MGLGWLLGLECGTRSAVRYETRYDSARAFPAPGMAVGWFETGHDLEVDKRYTGIYKMHSEGNRGKHQTTCVNGLKRWLCTQIGVIRGTSRVTVCDVRS